MPETDSAEALFRQIWSPFLKPGGFVVLFFQEPLFGTFGALSLTVNYAIPKPLVYDVNRGLASVRTAARGNFTGAGLHGVRPCGSLIG